MLRLLVWWFHCSVIALNRLLANHQGRLSRIYLLYTENVDTIYMWKGSKLCQTILGLVSKFASSVVCTTHDCFILSSLPHSCLCDTYCTKLHPVGDLWKLTWSKQCSRSLRLDCHESWMAKHAGINSREGDVWSKSLVIFGLKTKAATDVGFC
jgi:hypothetical protein